jgi:hypothetical protein
MTQSQIESSLKELNGLVLAGNLMDAFEKFYHDDVIMQENNLPPTISKVANRNRELQFLNNVTEFRGADVKGIGVIGDLSYVIWHYDYTHKEWGLRNYSQVSIQEWKDGKIIKEIFVYNN